MGTVRPLGPEDLGASARLFAGVFASEPWGEPWGEPWTARTARRRLGEVLGTPGYAGFVCELGGEVAGLAVGCVCQQAEGAIFLHEMRVRPRDQGGGVGGTLLGALHAEMGKRGVGRVVLLTRREGDAEAFYRRHGYERDPSVALLHRETEPKTGLPTPRGLLERVRRSCGAECAVG